MLKLNRANRTDQSTEFQGTIQGARKDVFLVVNPMKRRFFENFFEKEEYQSGTTWRLIPVQEMWLNFTFEHRCFKRLEKTSLECSYTS